VGYDAGTCLTDEGEDIEYLKRRLLEVWKQSIIDNAIDQWRSGLRAFVRVKEGHTVHLM
jgi:hypothetical protein